METGLGDEGMIDEVASLEEALGADYTDDVSFAYAEEDYEWYIPTGRFNGEGQQICVKVVVIDPGDATLPTRYLFEMQRSQERAMQALWKACIKYPADLKHPTNISRTTSAFRAALTYRLLGLIGVNGDFFAAMATIGSTTGRRPATTSSSSAPSSTDETPGKSKSGTEGSSIEPTDSHTSDELKTASDTYSTSDTPSQKPSEESPLETSSTPSSKKPAVALGRDTP